MNCDTNELIRLRPEEPIPKGFTPVPDELHDEADELLGDKHSVKVVLPSPLLNWANGQRKKKARKTSRQSKKNNRS